MLKVCGLMLGLLLILCLAGCASIPRPGSESYRLCASDAVIEHWTDELLTGQINEQEYEFLVRGRVALRE